MKKGLLFTALIGIVIIILTLININGFGLRPVLPFNQGIVLENPLFAVKDDHGAVYSIDQSKRRITKINKDGRLEYEIIGGLRNTGNFFYADELAVDEKGFLYVINWVLDERGFYVEREEILRYKPDGEFDKVIFSKTYEDKDKNAEIVQRGRFSSVKASNGKIDFIVTDSIGFNLVTVLTEKDSIERRLIKSVKNADLLVSCVWFDGAGNLVYVTKRGMIIKSSFGSDDLNDTIVYNADLYSEDRQLSVPWAVVSDSNGGVYFTDLVKRGVYFIDESGVRPILNREIIEESGISSLEYTYYSLSISDSGELIACNEDFVVSFNNNGTLTGQIDSAYYKTAKVLYNVFVWIVFIVNIILIPVFFRFFYVYAMKKRLSIVIKQLLIFTPLLLSSITIISITIINNFTARYTAESLNKIAAMVQMIPRTIDAELIKSVTRQSDFMSNNYMELREQLKRSLNYNKDEWNNSYYFVVYRVIDGVLYGFMYLNGEIGIYYPFSNFADIDSAYRKAYDGEIAIESISDSTGSWLYGVGPIRDANNDIIAVLEIGTDLYSLNQGNKELLARMIRIIIVISIVFILLFILVTLFLLKSIRILRDGVKSIATGKWDTKVKVSNQNDEVADLSNGFNTMSSYILNYVNQIVELNEGYKKFVPEQFINYLDKKSVTDLILGDQVQKEMTILFSDIRSFTTMSEKMTPKENFDFLIEYLSKVGPSVRNYNGFIDKYIGDAIMALYPHCPDDGLKSSLEILNRLYDFNMHRTENGLEPIRVGMGLHTGKLMLGILGEQERMAGTVISDAVNLASRLEGLTKHYGASIIISETTFAGLKTPDLYSYRNLGNIKVKGKSGSINIFEILDGLTSDTKEKKIISKKNFEDGILFYKNGDLKGALERFSMVLKDNPDDKAAYLYYISCKTYLAKGLPVGFDGTIAMSTK